MDAEWVTVFHASPFTKSDELMNAIWIANSARRVIRVTTNRQTVKVEMRVPLPKSVRAALDAGGTHGGQ